MNRFEVFSKEELYMLKRQAMESSWEITNGDQDYSDSEKQTHKNLLNEIIQCIRERTSIKK